MKMQSKNNLLSHNFLLINKRKLSRFGEKNLLEFNYKIGVRDRAASVVFEMRGHMLTQSGETATDHARVQITAYLHPYFVPIGFSPWKKDLLIRKESINMMWPIVGLLVLYAISAALVVIAFFMEKAGKL